MEAGSLGGAGSAGGGSHNQECMLGICKAKKKEPSGLGWELIA